MDRNLAHYGMSVQGKPRSSVNARDSAAFLIAQACVLML